MRVSDRPADKEHPFGHGKFESFGGLLQAVLLLVFGVYVAYQAWQRLKNPVAIQPDLALAVALGAAVVKLFVSRRLSAVAEKTDSDALRANAANLSADFIASAGVITGLLIAKLTGNPVYDAVAALIVTTWILFTGLRILWENSRLLVDTRLPEAEVRLVEKILSDHPLVLEWHRLRTRKSGSHRHIDVHILLEDNMSLVEAHETAEDVEDRIRAALMNVSINVHMEPYLREREHQREEQGAP